MATSTDYWLQGMQVANQEHENYLNNQQKNRDYLTKNKLYYGEDWRGDEKGNTDFKASEEARKTRAAEDARAAAEVYLGGHDSKVPSTTTDPRAVPGMSEAGSDFGAPKDVVESVPNARVTTPVTGDLGAPSSVPVVRLVTPPNFSNTDSADGSFGNWNEVLASFPKENTPEVQPDAPRYIPAENTLGSPPVVPVTGPVVAPPVGNDFGASTIPTTPVRPVSPVPNTSTFGAPLATAMPTAKEVFDRVDPRIQRNPAFLNELRAYEKHRLDQVAKIAQAEELGALKAASAYNLLHERTKSAAELAAEKDKRAMERQNDKQEFEEKKYNILERGRNERYSTGIQTRKELAQLKVKAQGLGAPKLAGADDALVKESGRQLANKTMAADVMDDALAKIDDPNTDPAVAYAEAQSLYKAINSSDFRSDAVNGEEAKRIGQLLDINLNPVKVIQTGRILPSLDLYKQQVRDNVTRIRKEADALNNRISAIYAKPGYGWDYQNARPLGNAPSSTSSGTPASSGTNVITLKSGKKVVVTP